MDSEDSHLLDRPHSRAQEVFAELLGRTTEIENRKLKSVHFSEAATSALAELSLEEMAELFASSSLLETAIPALIDQHWIETHEHEDDPDSFRKYLAGAFHQELKPLAFLSRFFESPDPAELRIYGAMAREIAAVITERARKLDSETSFREFTTAAMKFMNRLTHYEAAVKTKRTSAFSNSMYRAFDEMDRILGISYDREKGMRVDPNIHERLYEGAGIGVQTSYSTILLALEELAPAPGSLLIDLGSGYGRVGLVAGLLRPDVSFIGYEYVGHRVDVAQASADRAGLSDCVRFFTQDLSDPAFKIPEAEIYYMYDPFSQETYQYVFDQLKTIGRRRPITVVTKGRANGWMSTAMEGEKWSSDLSLDEGTIGIFRSSPTS